MAGYKKCQNSKCEYFPCHKGVTEEEFNCLFCYCPLYVLGEKCGGNFSYTPYGLKDCSECTKPHGADGYDHIQSKLGLLLEIVLLQKIESSEEED